MKTKIYSLLVALMSVVALTGCDDWTPGEQGGYPANTGGVSRAKMDVSVNDDVTAIGRASVDTSDYIVTVTEKGTDKVAVYDGQVCSWTYSAMPQIFTLPVGDYTVTVRSHEPADAAWSAPYFEGQSDFTVKNNEVTYIGTVTCNFASVKVEVRFSQSLSEAMDADSHVEVLAGVAGTSLTWSSTETRIGYFYPAEDNPTIIATFTGNVKGQTVSATKNVTDAKRGNYYIFTFSLNTGNPLLPDEFGNITDAESGVTIDFEVIESNIDSTVRPGEETSGSDKHPDTEEWPEEPVPPVDPIDPVDPDQPGDEPIDIKCIGIDENAVNPITGDTYMVTFNSKEPISNIIVSIDSPYLTNEFLVGVGLSTEFDLAHPDQTLEDPEDSNSAVIDLTAPLQDFGLPVGYGAIHKTSVEVDLSTLIPLLSMDDEKGRIHTFNMTVIDDSGNKETKALKFIN